MKTGDSSVSVAITEKESYVRLDIGILEIKDTNSFFLYRCFHTHFPGKDILASNSDKIQKETILLERVNAALDFDASYDDLEYTNMGFQDMSKEILEAYKDSYA